VIAKVGNMNLKLIDDGRTPEHIVWKRGLEKAWAGDCPTLAKLTEYRFKIGLDPAFAHELPEFRKGNLHWYEWVLCQNGGKIHLYDDEAMTFTLYTTTQTADKVLGAVGEASLALKFDERLSTEVRFPQEVLLQVCELAGARKARKGQSLTPVQREAFEEGRKLGQTLLRMPQRPSSQTSETGQNQEIMAEAGGR
jgi:hypothetical protein